MLFSLIIPTCHRNDALKRCLARVAPTEQIGMTLFHPSFQKFEHEGQNTYEIIVTDDGFLSTAEWMLRNLFPWAQWVSGPKRGPAANRNHGAKKAAGDWLVFVDDDCVPAQTLLAAYARAAATGNCSVLEGMTLPEGKRESADLECPVNTSGGNLWSCNFAIKRHLFMNLGGFDEKFSAPAMEDIDIHTRLFKSGHKTEFVSEARVNHPWRPRRGLEFLEAQARSFVYYVEKHPEYRRWMSWTSLIKRVGGVVLRDFPKNLISYRGKGAVRTLTLELVFVVYLFKYLTRKNVD